MLCVWCPLQHCAWCLSLMICCPARALDYTTGVPVARALEYRGRRMRSWRLISARKHGWCCKLQCFLWHNRGWSVKTLDVVFIFPSIGWQHRPRARRIPSIGCLLETEYLFFICTWKNPSIGIRTCEASAKEEMHMRSRQRTFSSTRTYNCWRVLREKRMVLYGKIHVRPRLSESPDVNNNSKQTQRSNMGSILEKHSPKRGGVNFWDSRR